MSKIKKSLTIFLLAVLLLIVAVLPFSAVFAEETTSSNVVDDLSLDDEFNVSDYPYISDDYSLQIIQIAETSAKELFIYVYNPSRGTKDLIATSITFSTGINNNLNYKNYKLKLLNRDGVFSKYVVNGFVVKDDALRYYDISEIFRNWDETIDEPAEYGNTITEVSYSVAQLWSASTVEGVVSYEMAKTEVITITDKYVGYLNYPDGFILLNQAYVQSHFVAFSTDYNIDYLLEAQLEFLIQRKDYTPSYGTVTQAPEPRSVQLTYSDTGTNGTTGLFAKTYVWNRIEKVSDFSSKEDLTDEAKTELQGKEWVLRFVETEYSSYGASKTWYFVSEVTILRLKFQTAGKTYNLGVVDNKQTGDGLPDNELPTIENFFREQMIVLFSVVLSILGFVVFILVVIFLIKYIFKIR